MSHIDCGPRGVIEFAVSLRWRLSVSPSCAHALICLNSELHFEAALMLWPTALLFSLVMSVCLLAFGLYSARQRARVFGIVMRVLAAVIAGIAVTAIISASIIRAAGSAVGHDPGVGGGRWRQLR